MAKSIDISFDMGGIHFKNPFVVGAGPTVRSVDQIKAAEQGGWAGASMKLAIDPFPYVNWPPRYRWKKKERYHIFTAEKRLTAKEALTVLEEARKATSEIVIIPTITYDGEDFEGWGRLAKQFEDAGAQVIELNMCCPNMSYNITSSGSATTKHTGASLGNDPEGLKKAMDCIAAEVSVPIIVKLNPEGTTLPASSHNALKAGAAAVGHTANRLGIPDIDIRKPMQSIYRLQDEITLGCMSGPWLRPLALRDTYTMRKALGPDPCIFSSGGIHNLQSAVEHIMVGADGLWVCTETMLRGFDWLPKVIDQLKNYMQEMGYTKLKDFRDILHQNIRPTTEITVREGHAEVDLDVCTSCGLCWRIGHCTAITHPDGKTVINAETCLACSTCVDICPVDAIKMVAKEK